MNTRVQVEHTVTEMATGHRHRARADQDRRRRADLVRAGGGRDPRLGDRVPHQRRGRAQEVRSRARARSPPTASRAARACASTPASRRARRSRPLYDPMVAKLIVWDTDREAATARMLRALDEFEIGGLTTLIPFHKALLRSEQWQRRRDLPRPGRGPEVAQVAGARGPRGRRAAGGRGGGEGRARLHGRGRQPPLRRQGDRPAAGRRAARRRELDRAAPGRRGASAPAARCARTAPAETLVVTAAGHGAARERREGPGGRGGRRRSA